MNSHRTHPQRRRKPSKVDVLTELIIGFDIQQIRILVNSQRPHPPKKENKPVKPWSDSTWRLNHAQKTSKSGLTWNSRCCSRWRRAAAVLQTWHDVGNGVGRWFRKGKKTWLKLVSVKRIGVPPREWRRGVPYGGRSATDVVRRQSLAVCYDQSTVIGRVLRVGITENSVCLAAYHWQMHFSAYIELPKHVSNKFKIRLITA